MMHRVLVVIVVHLCSSPCLITGLPESYSRFHYKVDPGSSVEDKNVQTVNYDFRFSPDGRNDKDTFTFTAYESDECLARNDQGVLVHLELLTDDSVIYAGSMTTYDRLPRDLRLVKCWNYRGDIDLNSLICPRATNRGESLRRSRRTTGEPTEKVCQFPQYINEATPRTGTTTPRAPQQNN